MRSAGFLRCSIDLVCLVDKAIDPTNVVDLKTGDLELQIALGNLAQRLRTVRWLPAGSREKHYHSPMIRLISAIAILLASAATVSAHHGFGTFELNKSVTYTGKLTRLEFINPHSWLYFEVTDANGKVTKHRCEMRSAHTLRRSGWKEDLFPVGQQVTIEAAPDRADPQSCYLNTIRFANGSHMDRYGQYISTGKNKVEEVRGPLSRRGGVPPSEAACRADSERRAEPRR